LNTRDMAMPGDTDTENRESGSGEKRRPLRTGMQHDPDSVAGANANPGNPSTTGNREAIVAGGAHEKRAPLGHKSGPEVVTPEG
jgi:hypothetical protein